jgi:hypothetical protein
MVRVGLSRNQRPEPLLSTINRQPTKKEDHVGIDAPVANKNAPILKGPDGKPAKKSTWTVDEDHSPVSSSSEDEDSASRRGDIKPTKFGEKKKTGGCGLTVEAVSSRDRSKRVRTSTQEPSTKQSSQGSNETAKQPDATATNDPSPSPARKKTKRSSSVEEQDNPGSGDIFPPPTKPKPVKTFSHRFSRQQNTKSESSKPPKPRRDKAPPPKKQERQRSSSPVNVDMKLPQELPSLLAESPGACKFKDVPGLDTPVESSPIGKVDLKSPPSLPTHPKHDDASQYPALEIPPSPSGGQRGLPKMRDVSSAIAHASNLLLSDSSSPLSDLESLPDETICPLCRKPVDKSLLDEFQSKQRGGHMTVAAMRRFCDQHQRRSAREDWLLKGYPDIQWDELDARIAKHHAHLRRILAGDEPSHYAARFEESIRRGRNRTLLTSSANLTPGYYGLRGLRAMTENLITEFAPLLRERAVRDSLVSARGYTTYLQSVLVPELAVRLIMEDMGCEEGEARTILAESSGVGELLNDEIADVVVEDSSSSEEEQGKRGGKAKRKR